ncbi:PiT family inorganic phosphate transporter [Brachybacterium muris]|uniref:inorganic phosphate transporter n=1 Tax=Brachybacterium muris TaxID=219301 RepID=UPI00195AF15E|nr:inorganic phosphate transporter [Brachybacterium muris]MBM7499713.1 PiT family inorganic phosphate transporter [Brachybacterium muris]MCT1430490.1 inorganic phosphate transporter [Brachybacterium muris]MCT2260930.1 inorganic phosphate transporter [Brachybacterium muris]
MPRTHEPGSSDRPAVSGRAAPAQYGALGPDRNWHLGAGLILVATAVAFTIWAFTHTGTGVNSFILILAIAFGLFMAFNIGGNDVANSFGTSVGAGTLTMKQALVVAAVFEVSGAVLAGGSVTETVRSGIVDLGGLQSDAPAFAYIMMSALLGAAVWLLLATRMGWPVSTTHAIIGGIVGAAVTTGLVTGTGGLAMVQWGEIGQIAVSWVLSPLLGGIAAYLLFGAIKRRILAPAARAIALGSRGFDEDDDEDDDNDASEDESRHVPGYERVTELQQSAFAESAELDRRPGSPGAELVEQAGQLSKKERKAARNVERKAAYHALEKRVPPLAAGAAVVIAAMLMFKGLGNVGLEFTLWRAGVMLIMLAVGVWMATTVFARALRKQTISRATFIMFSWLQVFTACAFAFSHGANDIANAVGPFAAVLDVLRTGTVSQEAAVPMAVLIAFGVALIAGLWFVGRKVIHTVGTGLTSMHPSSGFAAELAAAATVLLASVLGLPVSSTHILIGAVLGVGIVNRAANWKLMRPIFLAWIITLPAAAGIGAVTVLLLRALFLA